MSTEYDHLLCKGCKKAIRDAQKAADKETKESRALERERERASKDFRKAMTVVCRKLCKKDLQVPFPHFGVVVTLGFDILTLNCNTNLPQHYIEEINPISEDPGLRRAFELFEECLIDTVEDASLYRDTKQSREFLRQVERVTREALRDIEEWQEVLELQKKIDETTVKPAAACKAYP